MKSAFLLSLSQCYFFSYSNPSLPSRLIDTGHAGVQQTLRRPHNTHHNPGQTSQSPGGALQHLLRGTNEVLVKTVTNSSPNSRRHSIDTTDDSRLPLTTDRKASNPEHPTSTSDSIQATLNSACASLSSAEVHNTPANTSEALSGPLATPEDSTTEVESFDELDEVEQPSTVVNGWKGAVTNLG